MARASFTQSMRERADAIWRRELEHPFVRGIADGTLALDKFRFYLCQDYVFLIEYARVFALASAKARTLDAIRLFADLLHGTINTEMQLHRDYCAGFGIDAKQLEAMRPAPTTHAYTRHLLTTAYAGSLADIVAAVLPCQLGYCEIGSALAREGAGGMNSRYADWIKMYASDEFAAGARRVAELLDELAAGLPERELERLAELFLTSSRWEYLFWEMSWTRADWPV
jgi:thiaminase/transcriptional activator TenA